jgi:hypothetical protein
VNARAGSRETERKREREDLRFLASFPERYTLLDKRPDETPPLHPLPSSSSSSSSSTISSSSSSLNYTLSSKPALALSRRGKREREREREGGREGGRERA